MNWTAAQFYRVICVHLVLHKSMGRGDKIKYVVVGIKNYGRGHIKGWGYEEESYPRHKNISYVGH